jgi:hypothetical protein
VFKSKNLWIVVDNLIFVAYKINVGLGKLRGRKGKRMVDKLVDKLRRTVDKYF